MKHSGRYRILLISSVFLFSCGGEQSSDLRLLVPDGFRGVVRIFESPEAARLSRPWKLKVDARGNAFTQALSDLEVRHGLVVEWPNGDEATARGIHEPSSVNEIGVIGVEGNNRSHTIFVGTRAEYQEFLRARQPRGG